MGRHIIHRAISISFIILISLAFLQLSHVKFEQERTPLKAYLEELQTNKEFPGINWQGDLPSLHVAIGADRNPINYGLSQDAIRQVVISGVSKNILFCCLKVDPPS